MWEILLSNSLMFWSSEGLKEMGERGGGFISDSRIKSDVYQKCGSDSIMWCLVFPLLWLSVMFLLTPHQAKFNPHAASARPGQQEQSPPAAGMTPNLHCFRIKPKRGATRNHKAAAACPAEDVNLRFTWLISVRAGTQPSTRTNWSKVTHCHLCLRIPLHLMLNHFQVQVSGASGSWIIRPPHRHSIDYHLLILLTPGVELNG